MMWVGVVSKAGRGRRMGEGWRQKEAELEKQQPRGFKALGFVCAQDPNHSETLHCIRHSVFGRIGWVYVVV